MSVDPLRILANDPLSRALFRYQKARRERLTVEAHLESVGHKLAIDGLTQAERDAGMELTDLLLADLGLAFFHRSPCGQLRPSSVAEAVTAIDLDTD